jgi:hypothetical protein
MPFDGGRVWPLSQRTTRYVRISSCERPEADSALPLGIQEPEVLMANDPKTDEAQGKRDTEEVLTDKDEKKRQEEESKEKPVDPE